MASLWQTGVVHWREKLRQQPLEGAWGIRSLVVGCGPPDPTAGTKNETTSTAAPKKDGKKDKKGGTGKGFF
eukprot:14734617-Alexandrium_andersonii.AAC.1